MTERVKICQVVLKSQNGQTLTGARVPPHQETSQQPLNRSQCSRLFNRQRGKINDVPIHSAFDVGSQVEQVESPLFHFSKATISVKVKQFNNWTDELSVSRFEKNKYQSP